MTVTPKVDGRAPRTGVVVLLYDRWPEARETLWSLCAQEVQPCEVVVVDNASPVDDTQAIAAEFPEFNVVRSETNRGYAAGMNVGLQALRRSDCDVVALVTHDCVLSPDALSVLAEQLLGDPALGVVGPLLCYRSLPSTIFSAGGRLDAATWRVSHRFHREEVDDVAIGSLGVIASDWLDGSCLAFRPDLLESVGWLDENFFLYYEDVEWGIRCRSAGYKVMCVAGAMAWQEPGGALSTYLDLRNRLLLMSVARAQRRVIARELARGAYRTVLVPRERRKPGALRTWARALRDARRAVLAGGPHIGPGR